MKLSRLYWLRLLVTPALIYMLWQRLGWLMAFSMAWVMVSAEITYFRTRTVYRFLFQHALTGTPHAKKKA